jgi:hypothetical protein
VICDRVSELCRDLSAMHEKWVHRYVGMLIGFNVGTVSAKTMTGTHLQGQSRELVFRKLSLPTTNSAQKPTDN